MFFPYLLILSCVAMLEIPLRNEKVKKKLGRYIHFCLSLSCSVHIPGVQVWFKIVFFLNERKKVVSRSKCEILGDLEIQV